VTRVGAHVEGARVLRDVEVAVVGVCERGDRPALHGCRYQVPPHLCRTSDAIDHSHFGHPDGRIRGHLLAFVRSSDGQGISLRTRFSAVNLQVKSFTTTSWYGGSACKAEGFRPLHAHLR